MTAKNWRELTTIKADAMRRANSGLQAVERAHRGRYRVSETVLRRDSLSDFNDGCKDLAELRALILQARAAAMRLRRNFGMRSCSEPSWVSIVRSR
jgi:hypothetical protein